MHKLLFILTEDSMYTTVFHSILRNRAVIYTR